MLVPAQAVGNAAVQAGGPADGGSAEMARHRESVRAIISAEEHGAAQAPVGVEAGAAVQPTPVSAHAVKVDLDADRPAKDGVVEYPVTGPDRFARTIAEAEQYAFAEEQREASAEAREAAVVEDAPEDPPAAEAPEAPEVAPRREDDAAA